MKKIKDLSASDRPREKLQAGGPEALSDLELLAILLGSGTRDGDVLTVAALEFGIRLLDHIIINQKGCCSFLEKGLI